MVEAGRAHQWVSCDRQTVAAELIERDEQYVRTTHARHATRPLRRVLPLRRVRPLRRVGLLGVPGCGERQAEASTAVICPTEGFTMPALPMTTVGTVSLPLAMDRTTAAASGSSQMFTR